jgi:acyl-ACP thioesterase
VSLWIRIDAASGRPIGLGERFHDLYGPTAGGRTVSTRLRLPPPPDPAATRPWPVRRVDLDPLGHVNNAVHWAIVEETLPTPSRRGRAEIEYLRPIDADTDASLAWCDSTDETDVAPHGSRSSWLVTAGTVLTAARWAPAT